MRVIAGTLKGRRLNAPTWDGLRPTSDKLRETLFNILAPWMPGARVLDAFAGTGALGIEAISRGAVWATFVEQDRRAQALIAENLDACGIADRYAIIRAPFARGVAAIRADPAFEPFDVVLIDPPYDQPSDEILSQAADLVNARGRIVLEHAKRHRAPAEVARAASILQRVRQVRSGDSMLSFYELTA